MGRTQDLKFVSLSLKDIPIDTISGENVILNTSSKEVLFPFYVKRYNLTRPTNNFYDCLVLNNCFVLITLNPDNTHSISVLDLRNNTEVLSLTGVNYKGVINAGDKIALFYNNDTIKLIDSNTLNITTKQPYTINGGSFNILKVRQLNSQMFTIISSSPTTVFIFSILDLLNLFTNNTGDLTSFTYATSVLPSKNVDVLYYNNDLYVFGDDGTIVYEFYISDLVYLKTISYYTYKYLPFEKFPSLSSFGSGLTLDKILSDNTLIFYNQNEDTYFQFNTYNEIFYFSSRYVLTNKFIYDTVSGDLFEISTKPVNSELLFSDFECRLSVKYKFPFSRILYSVSPVIKEILYPTNLNIQIETKYMTYYNTFAYNIHYNRPSIVVNLYGDTFIVNLLANYYLRLQDLILTFIEN